MTPKTLAAVRSLLDVLVQNERRAAVSSASRIVLDAASREADEGLKEKLTALSVEISALTPVYVLEPPTTPEVKGSPDALPPETEQLADRPRVRPVGRKRRAAAK